MTSGSDGLVRPLNAPQGQQILPGVQPGVTGGVVLAQYVIIFGTAGGLFIYSGSPAPGNPPVFSISNASEDPYGNAIAPGIWAGQFPGVQAGLDLEGMLGQVALPTGAAGEALAGGLAGAVNISGRSFTQIFGPQGPAPNDDRAIITFFNSIAGSGAFWQIIYNSLETAAAITQLSGGYQGVAINGVTGITAVNPSTGTSTANPAQPETWHKATLINGWAGSGSGVNGLFYRLKEDVEVELLGDIINTTATGNSTCFTLPAGYRPLTAAVNLEAGWNDPAASNSASVPWLNIGLSGNVQVTAIQVANKEIFFRRKFPLLISTGPVAPSFTPVGGLIAGTGISTFTNSPANIGDLCLVHVTTSGSAPATAISGGNCTWVQVGTTFNGSVNAGFSTAVFAGTATGTGAATATVTFAGSPASIFIDGQEYTSSTGTWTFMAQGNLDSAGTATMPSLTTSAGDLYQMFAYSAGTSVAGATTGFTYIVTGSTNGFCYDAACTAAPQAPVWGNATNLFGVAVRMQPH